MSYFLFSHENKESVDALSNVEGSQTHYVEQKKEDTKEYILHESIKYSPKRGKKRPTRIEITRVIICAWDLIREGLHKYSKVITKVFYVYLGWLVFVCIQL
jgi:hypothetical protein